MRKTLVILLMALGIVTGGLTQSAYAGTHNPPAKITRANSHSGIPITNGAIGTGKQEMCSNYGAGGCLQPDNGNLSGGNTIGVGGGNWNVVVNYMCQNVNSGSCTVCSGNPNESCGPCFSNCNPWPFLDGSGLNAKYDGDFVYGMSWFANSSLCVANNSGETRDHQVVRTCSNTSTNQMYVNSGNWLINVAASNSAYVNNYADFREPLVNQNANGCNGNGDAYVQLPANGSTCYNNWF